VSAELEHAALWAGLHGELTVFARRGLARAVASSPTARAGVGDLTGAAEDVAAEVLLQLWERRERWHGLRDPRGWAFGMARVQVARHVRAARSLAALEVHLPDDGIELLADRCPEVDAAADRDIVESHARAWALARVRAAVVDRLGADAWDQVVMVTCGSGPSRARAARAVLAEQVRRVGSGAGVDVASVACTTGLSIGVWATGQVAARRGLNPARAVADGVATSVGRARRALARWRAEQAALVDDRTDADLLVASGVVDDLPNDRRADAARSLVGWLAWAHPHLVRDAQLTRTS
jgi:hypothetical protein